MDLVKLDKIIVVNTRILSNDSELTEERNRWLISPSNEQYARAGYSWPIPADQSHG